MNCILIGSNSDIAQGLLPLLQADGWNVATWKRGDRRPEPDYPKWDLLVCCIGRLDPVGKWLDAESINWDYCVTSNLLFPLRLIRDVFFERVGHNPDASVCFLAGTNPNKAHPNYSAYDVSKMALLRAVENLDAEISGVKFFALGPGTVMTKMHKQDTLSYENESLKRAESTGGTTMEQIYGSLMWCVQQPKAVLGGRNIVVSDRMDADMANTLFHNPDMFKLRRKEE